MPNESGNRRPYRLISADQHVNEPPDLWTSRVDKRFRDRVPRMEHFEQGDAWVIEGVEDPINFGLNACAGGQPDELVAWVRFEDIRKGGYDPSVRLTELDLDGIDAAFMFPTPRISMGVTSNRDPELHLAMVRAYNDWLSEYCSHAPDRLLGFPILPNRGVREAIEEYERVMERPGLIGPVINCYPHGDPTLAKEDDALWEIIEQSGRPLTIHIGISDTPPTAHKASLPGDIRLVDSTHRMLEFMWTGVLDRFPGFKVVFAEVDCGWVPYFKEQVDNRYARMATASKLGLERLPSEYFDDHYAYTFITDKTAVDNRYAVGVENMMWSDDYPHVGADWPFSQRTRAATFHGVPRAERELILAGNAARLYHLPGLPNP